MSRRSRGARAGSPLFLFELLDLVRTTGSVSRCPDSVEAVIAADIDELSPADRTVLRYAAVLGTSFDPALSGRRARRDESNSTRTSGTRLGELVERGGERASSGSATR